MNGKIITASDDLITMAAQHEKKVRREFYYCVAFCVIAITPWLLSFVPALTPKSQQINLWFQRSGSGMTVFALFAQSKANYMRDLISPGTFSTTEFNTIFTKYKNKQKAVSVISLLLVIVGTVIWGYGDLWLQ
ncbi:MAG TPA: hypothetical protein DCP03_01740 [Polaromonas sp.]|uniref:hypothetical protein n=1 Tax=Polaromonas sp. UBA4122 TaxID=1947074 RepID=UPI000ECDB4D5|nr:hypothetical protein [Polaromonas sp. UBA4122]HAL36896.1 hypothetical protein [Polaromonas sp.]